MNALSLLSPGSTRRRGITLAFALAVSILVATGNSPDGRAAAQSCPTFGSSTIVGNLTNTSIREASGVVASRAQSNRYWTHNDSGDSARIFALTATGADRGTVVLGNKPASDFEDIAIGHGPNPNKDYLYVADIGNNGHGRSTLRIYRIAEPAAPGAGKTITIPNNQIETLVYRYENPNNPGTYWNRNAEGIFVDPVSGDLVIFEKQVQTINGKPNMGWVYRIPKNSLNEGQTLTAKPKVAVRQRIESRYEPLTGADISSDGALIIAKNGAETFAWKRGSGQTVFAALAAHPVSTCIAPKTPGEAIAIVPNGTAYISFTEAVRAAVWRTTVDYGESTPPPTSPPPTTTSPPPPPPPPSSGYTCNGKAATIVGTSGNDVLIGTAGRDVIMGLEGDDYIKGLGLGDTICGGPGRDKIFGNRGYDTLIGNDGADIIWGGPGNDWILGDRGYDRLYGRSGEDYIAGAMGNDKLVGGAGNDELLAGAGTDQCIGGAGDDDYESCE